MKVYCVNYISEEYGNPRTLLKICSTLENAEDWLDKHIRGSCDGSEEYGNPRTLLKICSTLENAEDWLDKHIRGSCDGMEEDWYWDERSHYEIMEEEVD